MRTTLKAIVAALAVALLVPGAASATTHPLVYDDDSTDPAPFGCVQYYCLEGDAHSDAATDIVWADLNATATAMTAKIKVVDIADSGFEGRQHWTSYTVFVQNPTGDYYAQFSVERDVNTGALGTVAGRTADWENGDGGDVVGATASVDTALSEVTITVPFDAWNAAMAYDVEYGPGYEVYGTFSTAHRFDDLTLTNGADYVRLPALYALGD